MSERIRQAELARRVGVSRQAIGDLVARGKLVVGGDGLLDFDEARAAIAANVHPAGKTASAARPAEPPPAETPPPTPKIDYHAARTLREFTEAQRAALKLRQESGELANQALLRRHVLGAVLDAREYLRNEPARLAVLLEGLTRAEREAVLAETFDQFLAMLSKAGDTPVESDD